MMKHRAIILWGVLLCSLDAHAGFVQPVQNLDIPADAKFVALDYEFRNDSGSVMKYVRAVADCDCVKLAVVPEDAGTRGIAPGDAGVVNVLAHLPKRANRISIQVEFECDGVIETHELTAKLFRLPGIVLSSPRVSIPRDRIEVFHRVRAAAGSLASCELIYDKERIEARIDGDSIMVRGLRPGSGREFVEMVETKEGARKVVGILEVKLGE